MRETDLSRFLLVFSGDFLDFFFLRGIVTLAVIGAAGRGYRLDGLSGTASSA